MSRRIRLAVFTMLVLAAALCGCASVEREACAPSDWYAVGLADGRAGEPGDRLVTRIEACAAHGVAFDREGYEDGRIEGLREYCTVTSGIDAGRSGRPYRDVCSDASEEDFLSGYYLGALSVDE
jgi:hypothetical protein